MNDFMLDFYPMNASHDMNTQWNNHMHRCQNLPSNSSWKYQSVEHFFLVTRNRAKQLR